MNSKTKSALCLIVGILFFGGCGDSENPDHAKVIGSRGGVLGKVGTPRGIATRDGLVYVIDRTGRVQQLTNQGEFLTQWFLEKYDNGTPTGIAIAEDGSLWIPDTHNSRIMHYSTKGELLLMFGEYGEEPGQFIYPTNMTLGDNGLLYITEYGVHDRVQVFNQQGEFQFTWGDTGEGEGQFRRAMGITLNTDGNLYIADAANHRVCVYTQQGVFVRAFGSEGSSEEEFMFPYDIASDEEGRIYVAEFGNHRIQMLSPEGRHLKTWGEFGNGPGQFAEPWGVAVDSDFLYVADTKNHRLQFFPR